MFERFTAQARSLVIGAQKEARGLGHGWIGAEHLLLAALRRPDEPGAATLVRLGVTAENCRAAIAGVAGGERDALGPEDAEALKALGIDLDEIRRRAESAFGEGALDTPPPGHGDKPRRTLPFGRRRRGEPERGGDGTAASGGRAADGGRHIPFTGRAKKTLELALREAIARKDRHIGVEHVVLALLRADDRISQGVFARLGVEPKDVRELVLADLRTAA
ncbi:Clp protease N-terminal domain-containing protein [Streptomyces sp. NPDC054796]